MDDVVSRQTVKRQMIKYGFHAPDMTVTEFVEDLSSVNSQKSKTEPRYCDRNICLRNEYNSIGCNECEVTKSQESNTVIGTGDGAYYRIKALQAQADGDLTTALCSLPKIQSSDGQEYVQLYDVLETVRRYKPSVAIPNKTEPKHWIHRNDDYNDWLECPSCGYGSEGEVKYGKGTPYCPYCGERLYE